jgi:hypothetical protein
MVAVCIVSLPALGLAGGDTHYLVRAVIAALCVAALLLLTRDEDGQLVARDVVTRAWSSLSR